MAKSKETLQVITKDLKNILGLVEDINGTPIRPRETRIDRTLEEELKRTRLTTNEPE